MPLPPGTGFTSDHYWVRTEARIGDTPRAATALLSGEQPPTALVCTSERLAVGAVLATYQLHLSVPADLSVVSLDDREQLSSQLSPEITRVERPDAQMAAHAAELLIATAESRSTAETRQITFDCPVVEGGSILSLR